MFSYGAARAVFELDRTELSSSPTYYGTRFETLLAGFTRLGVLVFVLGGRGWRGDAYWVREGGNRKGEGTGAVLGWAGGGDRSGKEGGRLGLRACRRPENPIGGH